MRKFIPVSLSAISVIFIFLVLHSCKKQEMEMENFSYENTFHLTPDTTVGSLKVNIDTELPVKFHNQELLNNIQKQIIAKVFSERFTNLPLDSIIPAYVARLSEDYKLSYEKDLEKMVSASRPIPNNEIQIEGLSVFLDSKILSYSYERYISMDGEYIKSNRLFYNFDLSNGHVLTENDLFVDNFQPALTQLIKQRIIEDNAEIESVADLHDFEFWEDKIKPNGNFYISNEGLVYVFNPYEKSPYSMEQTEVTLPFSRIKAVLKPDNLISYLYKPKQ